METNEIRTGGERMKAGPEERRRGRRSPLRVERESPQHGNVRPKRNGKDVRRERGEVNRKDVRLVGIKRAFEKDLDCERSGGARRKCERVNGQSFVVLHSITVNAARCISFFESSVIAFLVRLSHFHFLVAIARISNSAHKF